MRRSTHWRTSAILLLASLVLAACGGGADTEAATDDTVVDDVDGGGEINLDEDVEVAEGTVLRLPDCPSDWDPESGLTDDAITLYMSLPESGPVAALGGLDDGMRAWFDQMEPIEGRRIELVTADDAYDPARAVSNTEGALQTVEPFAFSHVVGTPGNLAIRDLLDGECMPQLFNASGVPTWGDPANYPWTIGAILNYQTEALLWCDYIAENVGSDATVVGLFLDNDAGLTWEDGVQSCADDGTIDLVETLRYDPATPDVTDEITTLAASNADVVVLGTTGAACPQSMAVIAQSTWDPVTILNSTCQIIPAYFTPVDPAGAGVIVATTTKDAGELDDPAVQEARAALDAAGLNPDEGSFYTGVIFGQMTELALRSAADMDGGLNRVNLMRAIWNADWTLPLGLDGATAETDGVNDAYLVEAAQFSRYVPPAAGEELGHYEPTGDLTNLEGETGSVGG